MCKMGGEIGGCEDKHDRIASADQETRLPGKMTKDVLWYNQMGVEIGGGEQKWAEGREYTRQRMSSILGTQRWAKESIDSCGAR